MKKEKEGFSLVELIIALAMTTIVMLIVIGLIGFGTRNMTVTRAKVNLQQDTEDAMRHISCYVMEASEVDTTVSDQLVLINGDPTAGGTEWVYWFNDKKIYFGKIGTDPSDIERDASSGNLKIPTDADKLENFLLAENVDEFSYSEVKDATSERRALKVKVKMVGSESSFESDKTIYLRNQEN